MVGDGNLVEVAFGDLDLTLHCGKDVLVRLSDLAVVPGLAMAIISFLRIQDRHSILLTPELNKELEWKLPSGYSRRTWVHSTPPAMKVAAMMRSGPPPSMNVNYFHCSSGMLTSKLC